MPKVTDKKVAKQVDELAKLNNEIRLLKEKIKDRNLKVSELEDSLRPILEGLVETEQRILITKKNVVEIHRRGYTKRNIKYKAAFELALTKVNSAVRKILENALDVSTTTSRVASSISSRERTDEGLQIEIIGKIINKIKHIVKSTLSFFKVQFGIIDKSNMILDKLSKMDKI